jgi:hypothetical protein
MSDRLDYKKMWEELKEEVIFRNDNGWGGQELEAMIEHAEKYTLVEGKLVILTNSQRDSYGHESYGCPHCNYEHWERRCVDDQLQKDCCECAGLMLFKPHPLAKTK